MGSRDSSLLELEALRRSVDKAEELIDLINKVPGCAVHKVENIRWDSVLLDITLDSRRDTV
jgi:hypothetical protein